MCRPPLCLRKNLTTRSCRSLEAEPLVSGAAQEATDILADRLPWHRLLLLPLPLPLALPLGFHSLIAELHQGTAQSRQGSITGFHLLGVLAAEILADPIGDLARGPVRLQADGYHPGVGAAPSQPAVELTTDERARRSPESRASVVRSSA